MKNGKSFDMLQSPVGDYLCLNFCAYDYGENYNKLQSPVGDYLCLNPARRLFELRLFLKLQSPVGDYLRLNFLAPSIS